MNTHTKALFISLLFCGIMNAESGNAYTRYVKTKDNGVAIVVVIPEKTNSMPLAFLAGGLSTGALGAYMDSENLTIVSIFAVVGSIAIALCNKVTESFLQEQILYKGLQEYNSSSLKELQKKADLLNQLAIDNELKKQHQQTTK